jgi:beta-galactosidase
VGLQHTRVSDPLAALKNPAAERLAIIEATPANLKRLADAIATVKTFTQSGGWLLLHGLTPEGLQAYNRLVGFEHMIRPFRMERVTLPTRRSPLTAGLTLTDVVMYNGERIFGWTSDEYLAPDTFSYCVDYEDVAPFAKMPSDYHYNIVNGLYSADAWKYIFSFDLNNDKPEFTMELPREQELVRLDWAGNAFYHLVTKFSLTTETGATAVFQPKPGNEEQTFDIKPPLKGRIITLKILDWARVSRSANVVGIDNLRLYAKRPPDFESKVRPLVNVGAMMEYPMGKGGIVLCNLLFKEREAVPVNATKKLRILSTLLANLQAPLGKGVSVIAGAQLEYEPVDISSKANQYRNERGWFGDPSMTLAGLPAGKNTFAGVPFVIHDFPTSPVPTVIMLGGPGVPGSLPEAVQGIPVGRKADALFFLHAARVDQPLNDDERRQRRHVELCRYVIHYRDGQTAELPICLDEDVADYRQAQPIAIPGAQIGWVRPYEGKGISAVLYVKQWNNPRPDVEIAVVDLTYGNERRGVPALIALTVARTPRQGSSSRKE